MELVNKRGNLLRIYPLFDPLTIQHSFEIMNDRRKNESLREMDFWTADSAVYRIEKERFSGEKEYILYLSNGQHNPFFKNFNQNINNLKCDGVYRPSKDEMYPIYTSVNQDTLRIPLSNLKLKKRNGPTTYLKIFPNKLEKLNETELSLVQFAYGKDNDLIKNMKMIYNHRIKETYINVLSPTQIQKKIETQGVEDLDSISQFCSISNFSNDVRFSTTCTRVGQYTYSYLRGVLLPPKSNPPRKEMTSYDDALDYLLKDPEKTLQNICDADASRLLKLISQYYES
jgi:hypothetical protein